MRLVVTLATAGVATDARRFLLVFVAAVLFGLGMVAAGLVALKRKGWLPAPPLTATNCIDSKFALMRGLPLEDRTMLAIGSSATWRNLDMSVFEERFPGTRAYNAAPCYIHIDQTAFMTAFMLERMPRVQTVVVVVAPRDFENCAPSQQAFFDTRLGHAYLSRYIPARLLYVTGFRPLYLAREALTARANRGESEFDTLEDDYGSSVLRKPHGWRPPMRIDPRCYEGVTALEDVAAAKGARLVIATVPIMPEWAATQDPDGHRIAEWVRRIGTALRRESSVMVDGRVLAWGDARFADPVHVVYPYHRQFSEFIADAIARRRRGPARIAEQG